MKRDSVELTNLLSFTIKDLNKKGRFDEVYRKAIKEDGLLLYFTTKKITNILQDSMPPHTLSVEDLYNLSLFFVKNKLIDIKLEDYFFNEDIKNAVNNKRSLKEKYTGDITIENVLFNGDEDAEEYITMLSYQEIGRMYDEGRLIYNFMTQRKAHTVKIKGRTERIADVNMESVYAIKEKMQEKDFHMNAITINMRITGEETKEHFASTNTLIIGEKTKLDLIDGYHRCKAIHLAWKENPKIEGKMVVIIKHLTVTQARDYIAQEAKGNINNREEMRLYDSSNVVAKMVKLINENKMSGNILKNRISMGNGETDTLIYYEVFVKSLDAAWDEILQSATTITLRKMSDFICEFYSIAYELICDKFKIKGINGLKGTMALDMMLMSGFLFPAAQMYKSGKGIDIDKISGIVDKVDLTTKDDNKYSYEDGNRYNFAPYKTAWQNV